MGDPKPPSNKTAILFYHLPTIGLIMRLSWLPQPTFGYVYKMFLDKNDFGFDSSQGRQIARFFFDCQSVAKKWETLSAQQVSW